MKILVLSDSHFRPMEMDWKAYDYVIHCGDFGNQEVSDFLFVRGNCDFKGEKTKKVKIKNKTIFITHGDLFQVKYGYDRLSYKAQEEHADLCFFGHTHRADMFMIENIVFINPGAYQDGYYAIINDTSIQFYLNGECYKKFKYKW